VIALIPPPVKLPKDASNGEITTWNWSIASIDNGAIAA
jgi:hypothetical protein